jgi:Histone methylation protein DOT1
MQTGAPYLPTFQKSLNSMFTQLRKQPEFQRTLTSMAKNSNNNSNSTASITFVDLGSGDGRIVFRAAKEGMFHASIGYEINPLLHVFACFRRLLGGPRVWSSTQFHSKDLWSVDLRTANVVAVVSCCLFL